MMPLSQTVYKLVRHPMNVTGSRQIAFITNTFGDTVAKTFVGEFVEHVEHPALASIVGAILDESCRSLRVDTLISIRFMASGRAS
jgi:hypothetical protein